MIRFLALISVCLCLAADKGHVTKVLPVPDRPAALVKAHVLPDPKLTPGAVYSDVTLADVKRANFSATDRSVPESEKRAVFKAYGIDPDKTKPGEYEIDHLISLCLGGSNDARNLWPESYVTQPLNAHTKDHLEVTLLHLVRDGKVPLAQAQREIAADWTKAYVKYVGPLPKDKTDPPAKKHEDD